MNADHQHFVCQWDRYERSRPIVLEGGGFGMRWSVEVAKRLRDELAAAIKSAETSPCSCHEYATRRSETCLAHGTTASSTRKT